MSNGYPYHYETSSLGSEFWDEVDTFLDGDHSLSEHKKLCRYWARELIGAKHPDLMAAWKSAETAAFRVLREAIEDREVQQYRASVRQRVNEKENADRKT